MAAHSVPDSARSFVPGAYALAEAPEPVTCSEKVARCFAECQVCFCESCVGTLYRRAVDYIPLASGIYYLVSSVANMRAFSGLLHLFEHASAAAGDSWMQHGVIQKLVHYAKILAAVSIPFALYSVGCEIINLFDDYDRLGAVLRLTEGLAWLGDCTATFTTGLHMIGAAAASAASWAFSFYVAGTFLSIATTILNSRSLYQGEEFLSRMESEPAQQIWEELKAKSPRDLTNLFDAKGSRIEKTIKAVEEQMAKCDPEEQRDLLDRTFTVMKERIRTKGWANRFAIVSSIVSCIGMIIFLFTPIAPLAYGLLALSAAISIVKFFYERNAIADFEESMKTLIPTEIVVELEEVREPAVSEEDVDGNGGEEGDLDDSMIVE